MSIISTELKEYRSVGNSDVVASQNGGLMSAVEIVSGIKNNVWPDVSLEQRLAGVTQYRKVFHKVENDDDDILSEALIHLTTKAIGDDYVVIFEGTQDDTEADISSPTLYGIGDLEDDEIVGAAAIQVELETSGLVVFRTGDTIWISDGVNSEYHENITVTSLVGNLCSITLSDTLGHVFLAANTVVASVIECGDIEATSSDWVESAAGTGDYDESTYPVVLDWIGSVEETWTITILAGGATFSVSGSTIGALDSGQISLDYSPSNGDFVKPYFTIDKDGWGAGWLEGDTITFKTHPAAEPIWRKRVVPVGSAALSLDGYSINFSGQTA